MAKLLTGRILSTDTLHGHITSTDVIHGHVSSSNTLHGRVAIGNTYIETLDPSVIKQFIEAYLEEHLTPPSPMAAIGTVELLADKWLGSEKLYYQVVSIEGVTENSQVDLTPDVEQLVIFYEKDLTFVTENDGGVVTVYAIGQKPTNDYSIQVTITEVNV